MQSVSVTIVFASIFIYFKCAHKNRGIEPLTSDLAESYLLSVLAAAAGVYGVDTEAANTAVTKILI